MNAPPSSNKRLVRVEVLLSDSEIDLLRRDLSVLRESGFRSSLSDVIRSRLFRHSPASEVSI